MEAECLRKRRELAMEKGEWRDRSISRPHTLRKSALRLSRSRAEEHRRCGDSYPGESGSGQSRKSVENLIFEVM